MIWFLQLVKRGLSEAKHKKREIMSDKGLIFEFCLKKGTIFFDKMSTNQPLKNTKQGTKVKFQIKRVFSGRKVFFRYKMLIFDVFGAEVEIGIALGDGSDVVLYNGSSLDLLVQNFCLSDFLRKILPQNVVFLTLLNNTLNSPNELGPCYGILLRGIIWVKRCQNAKYCVK